MSRIRFAVAALAATSLLTASGALAAGPGAQIATVLNESSTATVIHGTVYSANVAAEDYYVAYGPQSSGWCRHGGAPSAAPSHTRRQRVHLAPFAHRPVTITLSKLHAGMVYCAGLFTDPEGGGEIVTFRAGAPNITNSTEHPVSDTAERISGTVSGVAGQPTRYWFAWGPARGDWCLSDGAKGSPALTESTDTSASGPTRVSTILPGLKPGTAYCWSVQASNGAGATVIDFNSIPIFIAGLPTATTRPATAVARTTATLHGDVNAAGDFIEPKSFFAWDRAGSAFCRGGGRIPENQAWTFSSSLPDDLRLRDTTVQHVLTRVRGLRRHTTYCFEVVLWSSEPKSTTTYRGRLLTFTTG